MIHIPILRHGKPYESVDKVELVHHATGEPAAVVSQANPGMVVRDINRMDDTVLESFTVRELIEICGRAAERFIRGSLPIGDAKQSFDDYVRCLSATTGMPVTYCRSNAQKIHRVLAEMHTIISGLTRGFDLEILDRGFGHWRQQGNEAARQGGNGSNADRGYSPSPFKGEGRGEGQRAGPIQPSPGLSPRGERGKSEPGARATGGREVQDSKFNVQNGNGHSGGTLSFFREGRIFGAVLPSNSPGVHGLWLPAIALKAPIVLKPGREEPWTPLRIIEALAAEGIPREALGFYPTDHAGAGELLRAVNRAMLFGDSSTTATWANDPRIEIHGPGYSKVLLGDDAADDWDKYLDVMTGSISANGGRSCINASAIWTPKHGRAIADALANRLVEDSALPVDDPNATIAAFANAGMAERISAMIDGLLRTPGATDITEQIRGTPRLVRSGRVAYLLPTIIWCEDREHPLANREFLFPFASVVECPTTEIPNAIGPSLVVSAITEDRVFIRSLMSSENVDRLNIGAIPTYQLSWDQPHEGNLFEHLYRQRAFQTNVELQIAKSE